jgi:broad specificity phosphatase PhoE
MKTKFYFVRHGQTDRNTKGVLPDGLNDPLNEKGRQQALETAYNVPPIIDIAISSPLSRAMETRQIICDSLGCGIIVEEPDERLSEVNFGGLKGKTWDEAEIIHRGENIKERYRTQGYDFSSHGGDSYGSVKERVYSFINDMKAKHPGKRVLVATHAGIIRCIHKTETGYVFPDAPDNASVHEFEF